MRTFISKFKKRLKEPYEDFVTTYVSFWARCVLFMRKPFIIGITGSVGKTTCTAMTTAILMHKDVEGIVGAVGTTPQNMNNDIGLPLTVLRYENWLPETAHKKLMPLALMPFRAVALATLAHYPKMLVLEYGTGWKGHLQHLVNLAPPSVAIVTTIGPAHLERFKTLEGVAREKSAVVHAVPPSGLVILGQDHDYVSHLEREARAPVIRVPGRGIELLKNIAGAVCQHLGVPEQIISSTLRDFQLPNGRLNRWQFADLTLIDGSYNANPLSMQLALDTLAETPGRRRVAILGGMAELGEESSRYHKKIAAYARSQTDVLIGVGDLAKYYDPDHWFTSSVVCADQIGDLVRPGDCVLVKGSHVFQMNEVVARLRQTSSVVPQS